MHDAVHFCSVRMVFFIFNEFAWELEHLFQLYLFANVTCLQGTFMGFSFSREYPCDHYTSVINVTLLMTGCPRIDVHTTAVQLLQVLDKRFFGNVGPLQTECEKGKFFFVLLLLNIFITIYGFHIIS